MLIIRCLHTALLVSDLGRSENFYGQVLGLPKVDRVLPYPGAWYQVGDWQLHLIVCPDYAAVMPNREQWGRNPHISLAVANLSEAIARLQGSGYPVQMSASGRAALFTRDPDGNVIELSQG